jgi:hypothetical protein
MTVQALSLSLAYCAWTAAGQPRHGTFEVDTLDVIDHAHRGAEARRNKAPPAR